MVPGMSERERLAADLRRLDWLADAALGPARIGCALTASPMAEPSRAALPIGLWRRGLSSARVLGQRILLRRPAPAAALSNRASALVR